MSDGKDTQAIIKSESVFGDALVLIVEHYFREYVQKLEEYYEWKVREQAKISGGREDRSKCRGCGFWFPQDDFIFCSCEDEVCSRCYKLVESWVRTQGVGLLRCRVCGDTVQLLAIYGGETLLEKPASPYRPK